MYSPDTLERLNDEAVAKAQAALDESPENRPICEYCDRPADYMLPVYNPADAVREPPLDGAYSVIEICEKHHEEDYHLEENFYCPYCGKLFIVNHSWDVVAVTSACEGLICQKCYIDNELESTPLAQLLRDLRDGETEAWKRINGLPGKTQLIEVAFSEYSDFPGATTLDDVARRIWEAAKAAGLTKNTPVYPVITHGFQFACCLGIFYDA